MSAPDLRALLAELGDTQAAQAEAIGVSVHTLRGWLAADGRRRPTADAIAGIARAVDAARSRAGLPPLTALELAEAIL